MLSLKQTLKAINLSLMMVALAACQSSPKIALSAQDVLYDEGFRQFHQVPIESEQDIFYLDDEAKAFVRDTTNTVGDPISQMETLVHTIFDRSKFNLLYDGTANTVANTTFKNRAANCLSMSIMTYALAQEAGFGVRFQEIDIPEYWTRRDGYSLLNGHINLRMLPRPNPNVYNFQSKGYQVDFDPHSARQHFPKRLVSLQTVIAMFYNNKGADALLQNQYERAYAYFRQAIYTEPNFDSALINLGILYRLKGYYAQAEHIYDYALALNPDSLTAWENLAYLYTFTGRERRAAEIFAKVEHDRSQNPYYFVNLGEVEIEKENWQEALTYYKKALSFDRKKHEIYFGLARIYFELGEVERSEHYLQLAKENSKNSQDVARYQGKLNFLSSL